MPHVSLSAPAAHAPLSPVQRTFGPLVDEQIEIAVEYCGICHSDVAMLNNEWGMTTYPFVPGHEVVGTIAAAGPRVRNLKVGQRVGLGWFSQSCMTCTQCMNGHHNRCGSAEQTIVGRDGGFATRVRAHYAWATPLPAALDAAKAGPLFCGGITVFNPIVQFDIRPTSTVGVIGIGGLGHMALQFLNKWGCEVVAFTSSDAKAAEARALGATRTASSRSDADLAAMKGQLDFLLVTATATLNWPAYIETLAPGGRLHFVGVPPDPVAVQVFPLILGQRSVSGSPLGSPATTATMLGFAARHGIAPVTELFPMSKVNEALKHLESGKARYRIVLKNDLA